jgi:hypothetical protein
MAVFKNPKTINANFINGVADNYNYGGMRLAA